MAEYTNAVYIENGGIKVDIDGVNSNVPPTATNRHFREMQEFEIPIATYVVPVESVEEKARKVKWDKDLSALQAKLGLTKGEISLLVNG